MKPVVVMPFDPARGRPLPVPHYMKVVQNDGAHVVVEGHPPDNAYNIGRFLRIELEFIDGRIERLCKVHRRWTWGPSYHNKGKAYRSTARCNTSWVVPWMEQGF